MGDQGQEVEINNSLFKGLPCTTPEYFHNAYVFPALFKMIKKYNISKDSYIMDVGCGGGNLLSKLSSLGFKNLYGFDISASAVKVIQDNFPFLKEKTIIHNCYDENLGFGVKEFDCIISLEVIEHLFSPHTYLKNINKWLKEGGFLFLSTPYHGFLKNSAIVLTGSFDRHFDPLGEEWHIRYFSKNTLRKILETNGFEVIDFLGSGRFPFFWHSMVAAARRKTHK